jgi:hypothetical protein
VAIFVLLKKHTRWYRLSCTDLVVVGFYPGYRRFDLQDDM